MELYGFDSFNANRHITISLQKLIIWVNWQHVNWGILFYMIKLPLSEAAQWIALGGLPLKLKTMSSCPQAHVGIKKEGAGHATSTTAGLQSFPTLRADHAMVVAAGYFLEYSK